MRMRRQTETRRLRNRFLSPERKRRSQVRMQGVVSPSTQSQFSLAGSPSNDSVVTPSKATTTPSRVGVLSQSKNNALGTVSFYNACSKSKSPAVAIYSPSHARGRPFVECRPGEHMPYDEWWMKMRRENLTPSKGRVLNFAEASEPPKPQAPRCQLLQKPLSDFTEDRDRHVRLLVVNPSVSVTTLRRQIEKLQGCPAAEELVGKEELARLYVELVHG
mmetsp:Transcript_55683/g.147062  ORF Transcript_55683/g.147062 Transcript_55683/m.147062 type:complete len:218 (-) Transcript_55683:306-959(-)